MDLVDEAHFPRGEIRDDPNEIAGLFNRRAGGRPHRHAHLVRDHIGQRRLPKAGRTVQQDVIQGLLTLLRRCDRDRQVLADPVLTDVIVQKARTEPGFILRVLVHPRRRDNSGIRH